MLPIGVVLAVGYVAALALTSRATGQRVLPLYDGVRPPPRYEWVRPPKGFAAGNKVPRPKRVDVQLGASGSPQQGFPSDDGQLVLNLPAGAIPAAPAPGASAKATLTITPVDPATLAPLPDGAPPDGNAYRIDVAASPDGHALQSLALPGTAVLTVPQSAQKVFSSTDGQSWTEVNLVPVDTTHVSFRLASPGYVLASAAAVVVVPSIPTTADAPRTLAVVGATILLAAGLFLIPIVLRRARRGGGTA
jgi:hypothetical protein